VVVGEIVSQHATQVSEVPVRLAGAEHVPRDDHDGVPTAVMAILSPRRRAMR